MKLKAVISFSFNHWQNLLKALLALSLLSFTACEIKQDSKKTKKPPKFMTDGADGPFKEQTNTHLPKIKLITNNTIEVTVDLKNTKIPRHYIEVLVLVNSKEKQVGVKKFEFSLKQTKAKFKLPKPREEKYKVVAKCNLHDMWLTPVILDGLL